MLGGSAGPKARAKAALAAAAAGGVQRLADAGGLVGVQDPVLLIADPSDPFGRVFVSKRLHSPITVHEAHEPGDEDPSRFVGQAVSRSFAIELLRSLGSKDIAQGLEDRKFERSAKPGLWAVAVTRNEEDTGGHTSVAYVPLRGSGAS